jgi:RNA polymerase sigma-70 factor, ECF subfamily
MREDEFGDLAATYQAELRAHCYRMLGSVQDAEDALQEALVRAWKGIDRFEGRGTVRSWLYSIATNTALDIARHRSRREVAVDMGTSAGPGAELDSPLTDVPWLEPYPDQWLARSSEPSPEARHEQRESIELAFVAAVQHLPPLQRAVLVLRDVAGFSAAETAGLLGTSVASVTSALQRARAAAATRLPARSQQSALRMLGDRRTQDLVHRYADAMERGDIEALACYLYDEDAGRFVPGPIDVLTVDGDKIAAVTGFLTADILGGPDAAGGWISGAELYRRFGLPLDPP